MSDTPYPVYEKDGKTQIAATPQREVELQYAGWRRQETDAQPPQSDDTGSTGAGSDPGRGQPKPPKPPK